MRGFFGNWLILCACVLTVQATHDQVIVKRFAVLQNFLKQYSRPFTLIEINPPADSAFSPIIARDHRSTCLIFGSRNYTDLAHWAEQNKYDNLLIGFQSNAQPFFERLTECEHFDVVLIPEIYTLPNTIDPEQFDLYTKLGDHSIIECVCGKEALIPDELIIHDKILQHLATIERDTHQQSVFYYSNHPRGELTRRRWGARPSARRFYHITATFESKSFRKRTIKKPITWHHGINLNTFAKLHGIYPNKEHVVKQITSFMGVAHGDLALWNMVIQGKDVILIDWDRIKILDPSIEKIVAKFLRVVDSYRL